MIDSHRTITITLFISLVLAVGVLAAPSTTTDLGGTWQMIGLNQPAFPPPEAPGWQDVDVIAPVRAREWICQRRSFTIPAELAGQRLFLRFEGVKYTATVRCNGVEVGTHKGGYESFECEITQAANVGGANVVEVLAGSWHQLTADPEAAAEGGLGREGIELARDQILYPIGSHNSMGIWAPVSLEARPEVYIEDIYIIPSFREKTLTVQTTVRNLSGAPVEFALSHEALRDGATLLSLPPQSGQVAAGSSTVVRHEVRWDDPPLWWPHDPVLLQLQGDLQLDGQLADRKSERFGFRELWAEGPMFVLNGVPLHMLGSSCHPRGYTREVAAQTYDICREGNINAFRLHAQPWGKAWYDVADETGMLIMHETAVWCFARSYALADDRFWENFADHIRGQIKLHRNRPSVFSWSLENELLHVGGSRVEETEQRLADLAAVAREVDPTRLINYDGDEDPRNLAGEAAGQVSTGAADIINLHYPHNFPRNRLWPSTCWWLDERIRVEGWPRTEWLWSREKPLYIGEYLWQPSNTPDPYTLFFGDEAYTNANHYRHAAKGASWRYQVEAHRAQGMSGGCPWNVFEGGRLPNSPMYQASKLAYRPQCALIKEWDSAFPAGATITRTVTFINDVLRPAALKASWFCVTGGKESSRSGMTLAMQPAEIRHQTVELRVPEARTRAAFEIVVTLEEDGKEVFRETRPCWAIPPGPLPALDYSELAVYDPTGGSGKRLGRMGIEAQEIAALADIPDNAQCLLIGENAFAAPPEGAEVVIGGGGDEPQAVRDFVERGGRVIILAQRHLPQWLPASLMDDGSTLAFIRRPEHPLVVGCEPTDFRLWTPDHTVSHLDLARPDRGNAQIIVDAGGAGLNRALLMETRLGRGSYVFCQLPVVEKYDQAPIARQTLHRLLAYGLRGPEEPLKPVVVVSEDPKLRAILRRLGAQIAEPESYPTDMAALLVDGDKAAVANHGDDLKQWVRDGGLVWLHNPSAEYLAKLGLAREAVDWQPSGAAPLRALKTSGIGAGLRNEDLYWLSDIPPRPYANWALTPGIASHVLRPRLAPGDTTSITNDQFDNSTVPITKRAAEGIWLSTNGTVTAPINIPQAGAYVIGVLAGGTPMNEVFPAYSVHVDDLLIGGFMADSEEPSLHTVSGELPAGQHELRISFTNDSSNPPQEDRNGLVAGAQFAPALPLPDELVALTDPIALYAIRSGEGAYLIDGINWQDPGRNANKAARFVRTLLSNAGVEMVSVSRGTPVPLADFTLDPDAVHVRTDARGIYLGDTAWAEGRVKFAQAGRYAVILEARGTEADGEFPEIELSIDGEVIAAQHLMDAGWQDLVFNADIAAGERTIRIRFTNDLYDPAQHWDRNLWVRRLAIGAGE